MKKFRDNFIKLTSVTPRPGNAQQEFFLYAPRITSLGPCAEEYTKIGASTVITCNDDIYHVVEHYEDILKMLERIEVD